ncbi:MAG: hypothetical protein AB7G47_21910 [Mycolicibacterium sp.]|uniref:hypothetical protein n=1 Tax=Mycolicibacterium sp. TaxID=2320850 RepID=UPI003D14E7DA
MSVRAVTALSMTLAIAASAIGWTGPATAAPANWEMPNVRDMLLSQAVKAVGEATGSAALDIRFVDYVNGQEVHNENYWLVCAQNPAADKPISQKTKRVVFYVKRFNQKGCWS